MGHLGQLGLLALLVAAPAWALPPRQPTHREVERLLSGVEMRAVEDSLRALGPGVDAVLIDLSRDPKVPALRRVRALSALGLVPTAAGRDHCRAVIRDRAGAAVEGGPAVLEVSACARTLGAFGDETAPDLIALLGHDVAQVREAAARGLLRSHAASALAAVHKRLASERDPAVRAALGAAAAAIERR